MRVSSSLSLGSEGVARVRESFRSFILRASSLGSFTLSKRVDCLAYAIVAPICRSLACAARISVSSVMYVDWTQPARPASVASARSLTSAASRNAFASAAVGVLPAAGEVFLAGTAAQRTAEIKKPAASNGRNLGFMHHSCFSGKTDSNGFRPEAGGHEGRPYGAGARPGLL